MVKLKVNNTEINIMNKDNGSYISITDMLKSAENMKDAYNQYIDKLLKNYQTDKVLSYTKELYKTL